MFNHVTIGVTSILFLTAQYTADNLPIPRTKQPVLIYSGRAQVIDGDTLIVDSRRIRLYGIDAPELDQTCSDGWAAGKEAASYLLSLIGGTVFCTQYATDQYNRVVAVCLDRHDEDLNRKMVRSGLAYADTQYSTRYLPDEKLAKLDGAGVHSRTRACLLPWRWRQQQHRR